MASGLYKTEWWGAGMVICLERGADVHMAQLMLMPLTISCSIKIQIAFTFLVPAYMGCPGQRSVKRVCVCVCNCAAKLRNFRWQHTVCSEPDVVTPEHTLIYTYSFISPFIW